MRIPWTSLPHRDQGSDSLAPSRERSTRSVVCHREAYRGWPIKGPTSKCDQPHPPSHRDTQGPTSGSAINRHEPIHRSPVHLCVKRRPHGSSSIHMTPPSAPHGRRSTQSTTASSGVGDCKTDPPPIRLLSRSSRTRSHTTIRFLRDQCPPSMRRTTVTDAPDPPRRTDPWDYGSGRSIYDPRKTPQIQIGSTSHVLLACRAYSKRSTPVDRSDGYLYVFNDSSTQTANLRIFTDHFLQPRSARSFTIPDVTILHSARHDGGP